MKTVLVIFTVVFLCVDMNRSESSSRTLLSHVIDLLLPSFLDSIPVFIHKYVWCNKDIRDLTTRFSSAKTLLSLICWFYYVNNLTLERVGPVSWLNGYCAVLSASHELKWSLRLSKAFKSNFGEYRKKYSRITRLALGLFIIQRFQFGSDVFNW